MSPKIKSFAYRAARTFLQSFLAIITAGPLLELDVSTVKAAGTAGFAAVLSVIQRALDDTPIAPIPPG